MSIIDGRFIIDGSISASALEVSPDYVLTNLGGTGSFVTTNDENHDITGGDYSEILGGEFNVIDTTGNWISIIGGQNNLIENNTQDAAGSIILGGGGTIGIRNHIIGSTVSGIIAGNSNTIGTAVSSGNANNFIINSLSSTIDSQSNLVTILSSSDITVDTNVDTAVAIGVRTHTLNQTDTVYLPKVRIGVGSGGSMITDNANINVLVMNAVTGEIEINTSLSSPADTDDLSEGSVNFYYTDTRVSTNVDVAANTVHRTDVDNPHQSAEVGIHNGTFTEKQDIFIVVDTGQVYMDVELLGGGDLIVWFDSIKYVLDCTTGSGVNGRARIQLIQGAAINPEVNLVTCYLNGGIATLQAATTVDGMVSTEFAFVGITTIQDDVSVSANGPLALQRTTDNPTNNGRGRLSYIDERLRVEGAKWWNDVDPDCTITTNVGSADNVIFTNLIGKVYQLHVQDFPALDISVDSIFVVNASGNGTLTNYQKLTDLNQCLEYLNGDAVNDADRFSLVIWGTQNKTESDCKLYVNLPANGYSNDSNGYNDRDNFAVYSVPEEFRTTAFLIARIPLRYDTNNNGTWVFLNEAGLPEIIDLRGTPIGTAISGAGSSTNQEAADVPYNNTTSLLTAVNVQDAIDELDEAPTISEKTANYTLLEADDNQIVEIDGTFTVILGDLSTGFTCTIVNIGTGTVTLSGTIGAKGTLLETQWGGCTVYYNGTRWVAIGDLT